MKTKHILTAMALPALFAACTAEDVVNEGVVNTLQERATVSENFTLKVKGEADSRYAVTGNSSLNLTFENGDKIGAAIIDNYDSNNPNRPDLWEVIPSLAGNTPFTFDAADGVWTAPENLPLGVGHYLFVYPYNRADVNRGAVSYELPAVQKLYTKENGEIDLNAAIEANNKAFYAAVLTEGQEGLIDMEMVNLYTYPKFVINFDNGEKVTTVSKVVLAKVNENGKVIENGFEVKGGFNHELVADLFADEADEKYETNDVTDWSKVSTADLVSAEDAYTNKANSTYLVAELPSNAKVQDVTNNKYIEVRFMMPSFLANEDLNEFDGYKMYVYTDNGTYSFNLGEAIQWKNTTKTSAKMNAFALGKGNTININKNYVELDTDAPYVVTNIEDWNNLVDLYGDEDKFVVTEKEDNSVEVAVVGGSLVLDETAKMPTKAQFTVTAVTIEGEVELCNVIAGTVTVSENGVLSTCDALEADKIINYGKVEVEPVYSKSGKVLPYRGVEKIVNYGVVDVAEDADAVFELDNQKGAIVYNNGAITIEGSSNGVINNEGVIYMDDFEVLAPEVKSNGVVVNMPKINNDGKILTKGDVENNGTVINNGTLSCKNQAGTFTNNYLLDTNVDGLTYITENSETGEVIVYAAFQNDLVIEEQNGTVTYTTKNSSEAFLNEAGVESYVNNLNVTDDLTITAGTVATVNVKDDAKITLTKKADGSWASAITNLNAEAGTTVLGSDITLEGLYVAEGAIVKVGEGKRLEVSTTTYENKGEIQVAGVFSAKKISNANNEENVTESGANAQIFWKENADKELAFANYMDALEKVITDYINISERYSTDNYGTQWKVDVENLKLYINNAANYNVSDEAKNNLTTLSNKMEAANVEDIADDVAAAAANVASDYKVELIEALKNAEFTQISTLYDYESELKADKITAYEYFKEALVSGEQATKVEVANVVRYAANALTTMEIQAILEGSYAYIWKDCDLYKLAQVWISYKNFDTGNNDYNENSTAERKTMLIAWVKDVLKANTNVNPAIGQMQKALEDLGVTAANYTDLENYTVDQVLVCCGESVSRVLAAAPSMK